MISADKLSQILTRLLDRSQHNEVNWEKGESVDKYRVRLENSEIIVAYDNPSNEPDRYFVAVFNGQSLLVASMDAIEGDPSWPLLKSLWEEAHRTVTGWDRTLNEIERALGQSGRVGKTPNRPLPDEQIPF
jgi:hypothetical protein